MPAITIGSDVTSATYSFMLTAEQIETLAARLRELLPATADSAA
jgi:hypothetical protein